jgi:uncharacterized membrane protein
MRSAFREPGSTIMSPAETSPAGTMASTDQDDAVRENRFHPGSECGMSGTWTDGSAPADHPCVCRGRSGRLWFLLAMLVLAVSGRCYSIGCSPAMAVEVWAWALIPPARDRPGVTNTVLPDAEDAKSRRKVHDLPVYSSRCSAHRQGQDTGRVYAAVRHLLFKGRKERVMPESEVQRVYGYSHFGKTEPLAMSWYAAFRLRQFTLGSLWVLPLVGGLLGVVLGSGLVLTDQSVHLPSYWTYSASTASTVLSAIVGAMAALTGFVITVTVLVVQMATGMFSARYMRLWYRDGVLKGLLALLVGTLAFSFALLRRVENTLVPNLGVSIAGFLVLSSLLLFLIFFDRFLHRLRPVAVAVLVASYAHRDFERYAAAVAAVPDVFFGVLEGAGGEPTLIIRSAKPGAIQALDVRSLGRWARQHECLVVVCHRIGDFVPAGAKLIETYGGATVGARAESRLRKLIILGDERTVEQDPAFAIRIIVDIADKALSPAINDPTTAVQALNHLSDVLRRIGTTDFSRSRWRADDAKHAGVVIPARSWEEYLTLGLTEIREYGSTSIQVMRRMRAMLEELRDEVRPEHRPAVEEELARLDMTVARTFANSVDLDRANTADPQGIGGRTEPPDHSTMTR